MGKQHSECALCGKTIVDVQESSVLKEVVGGISYNFDTNQCVMMYKRFRSIYGDDFKASGNEYTLFIANFHLFLLVN
jgi:hypothetical protein